MCLSDNLVVDGVVVASQYNINVRNLPCEFLVVGHSHVSYRNHQVTFIHLSKLFHLVLGVFDKVNVLELALVILC